MQAYVEEGIKLIKSAKRTPANKVGIYQEDMIRNIIHETKFIIDDSKKILNKMAEIEQGIENTEEDDSDVYANQTPASLQTAFILHQLTILRNKRCLLTYHKTRMEKINKIIIQIGPSSPFPDKESLCPSEIKYIANYENLLTDYSGTFDDLDLLTGSTEPPKEPFAEVKVLANLGQVVTSTGLIHLEKDSRHFLFISDVQHFIKQKLVELI